MTNNQDLSAEEIEQIRASAKTLKLERNYTNSLVAREAGIAKSTLSQFLSDTYPGNNSPIAVTLNQWILNHEENENLTKKMARQGPYVETHVSKRVWNVLRYCLVASDMGAVISAPGHGKSRACVEFCAKNARCHYLSIAPSNGDVKPMLSDVLAAMKLETTHTSRLARRIIDYQLVGSPALLIIDEAQWLSGKALEELRAIHDATGCGLVLLGNPRFISSLNAPAKEAMFAQLNSRIGMKLKLPGMPNKADVETIAMSMADFDKSSLNYLFKLSQRPGALRTVTKTIKLAHMLVPANSKTSIGLEHLQAAHSQRS